MSIKKAALTMALCLCVPGLSHAYPTVYPIGTTIYKPDQAYSSYILVPEDMYYGNDYDAYKRAGENIDKASPHSDQTYLIDMNGNIVHRWTTTNFSSKRDRLLPNGHLLHLSQSEKAIIEYDWDGKKVWEYKTPAPYKPHHDVRRLENGNTLMLVMSPIPQEYQDKVQDFDIPQFGSINRKDVRLIGDVVLEVTPDKKIVWEWKSWEYLDVNRFSITTDPADWTHANTCSVIPPNKWYEAGDTRFKPGNIIFNPRSLDEVFVIDKDSKKIVYSWTNKTYLGGLAHGHEPQMIPNDRPGGGNIMFFDNGLAAKRREHAGNSFLHEFNPSTGEIEWTYHVQGPVFGGSKFFSAVKSTVMKLPNGNVFTDEDTTGRIFQIKPDKDHPDGGEIVWEYVHRSDVGRPQPYAYDYCPQLKALPRPEELAVTPPDRETYKLLPDAQRKSGSMMQSVK